MGEAWKKSEALAARRERQEVRERQAEERFTAQKRREFLSLIRNGGFTQGGNEKTRYLFQGLREWRQQNERKIDRSDEGKKEVSLGTQLGRRMADLVFLGDEILAIIAGVRYALEYARKQEELRQQKPLNRADQGGIRHPATDIINSLNPITWWVREGFI